jgi:PAS domain-containing protein
VFNASIDGSALTPDGAIVDINLTLWRMYGYSDEEFFARDPASRFDRRVDPPWTRSCLRSHEERRFTQS